MLFKEILKVQMLYWLIELFFLYKQYIVYNALELNVKGIFTM